MNSSERQANYEDETHRQSGEYRVTHFGRVVGLTPAMAEVLSLARQLAQSTLAYSVDGEAGTGKNLLCREIHERSTRASEPYVVLDARTLEGQSADQLVASVRAALREAESGTLVLREPLELTRAQQLSLHAELELAAQLGGPRLACVSRLPLELAVDQGKLQPELFFKVAVARLSLPPLRARLGDLPLLVQRGLQELGVSDDVTGPDPNELATRAWSGNVRELLAALKHWVELGALPAPGARLGAALEHSPEEMIEGAVASWVHADRSYADARGGLLACFERAYVRASLERHRGNVSRAARSSGIARRYFYKLLSRHAVPNSDTPADE